MKSRTWRTRNFALQLYALHVVLITMVVTALLGAAVWRQVSAARAENARNIRAVADAAANLPALRQALSGPNPSAQAQPIVMLLRESSRVDYVTVVGMDGRRIAHSNPALVGLPVSSDHSQIRAGQVFQGVEVGPTGKTFRVKMPIRDTQGTIRATLSLGIADERLAHDIRASVLRLVVVGSPALVWGFLVSWWSSRWIMRRFYNVDPQQMGVLLLARQALLHGASDGFVAIDVDGMVTVANPAAGDLAQREIQVGLPADAVLPPELVQVVAGREDPPGPNYHEVILDGRSVLVTSTAATVGGQYLGATLLLQDRTQLEEALRALDRQALEMASMSKDVHEFDNRLHVLGGLLTMGRHAEAVRLLERDLADPAGEQPLLALETVREPRLAALLQSRIQAARLQGVKIAVAEDSDVELGVADPDLLTTVVGNLLANAVEAGGTVITVYLQADEDSCAIVVDDDGPGIPQEQLGRVFEPGWSSKESSGRRRGLGLSLVKEGVEQAGGTVRVGRSEAGGASFEVTIDTWVGEQRGRDDDAGQ